MSPQAKTFQTYAPKYVICKTMRKVKCFFKAAMLRDNFYSEVVTRKVGTRHL